MSRSERSMRIAAGRRAVVAGALTLTLLGLVGVASVSPLARAAVLQGPLPQPGHMAASLCAPNGLPHIDSVSTMAVPGAPTPMGPQSGPAGTWVQITGSNLMTTGCATTVLVGGQVQVYPPAPVAAPPSPGATAPAPSPSVTTAPAPSATLITFQAWGNSGPVSVQLAAPDSTPALPDVVASNANKTFIAPPQISSVSPANPHEGDAVAMAGTGFSLGGLAKTATTNYFQGAATPNGYCDSQTAAVSTDAGVSTVAPLTYCNGQVQLYLTAPLDTADATQGTDSVWAVAPGTLQVAATITSINPQRAGPGDMVIVSGTGFGGGGTVSVGGVAAQERYWVDRQLDFTVPQGAANGKITLTRADGTTVRAGSFTLLAQPVEPAYWGYMFTGLFHLQTQRPRPLPAGETAVTGPPRWIVPIRHGEPQSTPLDSALHYLTGPLHLVALAVLALAVIAIALLLGTVNGSRRAAFALRRRRRRFVAEVLQLPRPAAPAAYSPDAPSERRILRLPFRRRVGELELTGRGVPLGHLLLGRRLVDRHALRAALHQQRIHGGRLGELLIAMGVTTEEQVWAALSTQLGVPLTRPQLHWVDAALAHRIDPADAIRLRILPLRRCSEGVLVAMADPADPAARAAAEEAVGARVIPLLAAPRDLRQRQERVYRDSLVETSDTLLMRGNPDASAHILMTRGQRRTALGLGVAAVLLAAVFRGAFAIGAVAAVITVYAAVVIFRTWIITRGARTRDVFTVSPEEMAALTDLPVYTILCPLYKEAGVLPQLVKACSELDYPKHLLDVKLLLEEDDVETLEVVERFELPAYFDIVVVPAEGPRTKPKACNYGLQFARGEYCVIFDAEDIPEPDQLKKALCVFRRGGENLGCVQGKLNFYNPRQNPITGWFALEYSAWFDFFLPGLVSLGLPVPLGGSSNHFPTALLRELRAWDPNNVTEDADLGMRLHRAGYRTVIVDSTTYEEANSDFINWMRQRSRWGKGYAVSWLVQMRHPVQLFREVGWSGFVSIQLTLGGTFGISLLNLFAWTLTLLWALAQFHFIQFLFPGWIYYLGMLEMLAGNFYFLYMGIWAADHRRSFELTRLALAAPVYWLMMSLAMFKAGMQLFTKPTFWEKTVHGLYETGAAADAADGPAEETQLTGAPQVAELPAAAGGEQA